MTLARCAFKLQHVADSEYTVLVSQNAGTFDVSRHDRLPCLGVDYGVGHPEESMSP